MTCNPEDVITSAELAGLKQDITTIDSVVESSLDTATTKSGKVINTLLGELKLLGYIPPVTYAGSIVFTTSDNTKTVNEAGVVYAPLPSALPFTTSGTFIGDDDARFFVVQGLTVDNLGSYAVINVGFVADMKTNTFLEIGDVVDTTGYTNFSDYGQNRYQIVAAATGVDDGGLYIDLPGSGCQAKGLFIDGRPNVKQFGAIGDDTTDDYAAIAAAYNSGAAIVYFPQTLSSRYKIDTGLTPPNGVILVGSGEAECRIRYTGTGTALTIGTSTTVLNKSCGIKSIKIELEDKTSKALHLVGTEKAIIEDILIEGLYAPFDNTRTNIGLHIDGADVSSFFNYMKNVRCTHIHEGYRIESTGTLQATTQYFINCTSFGDQDTDNTSIGYSFGVSGVSQEGQGTVISGGNVEKCNTCFLAGANAGRVTVDGARTEITKGGGTAWIFDFVDGCDPWTLTGVQGLGSSYMESNNGIRNFDSSNHVILSDEQGSIRLAGFDGELNSTKFLGIGGTNPEIRHDANSQLLILSMGDGTDTGRTLIQQGQGSAAQGGFIDMSGASHASRAGSCTVGPSSNAGSFQVNKGLGGTTHFEVSPQTGRINMVIPTSSAGLSAGDVWNNSGVVTIV